MQARRVRADSPSSVRGGRPDSRVKGTVLDVTDAELANSDRYEPDGYTRVEATLASGRRAWVYAALDADSLDHR